MAGDNERSIGGLVGGTTSFAHRFPTSSDGSVHDVRDNGDHENNPRQDRRRCIGPGHEKHKGKNQKQAKSRQQVGHD